jgi:hypothetical protein
MHPKGRGNTSSCAPELKALFSNNEYGLDNATATVVSAHLASQGCTKPSHLRDVDDDDVAEMVSTLGLLKYPARRLARLITDARGDGVSSTGNGTAVGGRGDIPGQVNAPELGAKRQRQGHDPEPAVLRQQCGSAAEQEQLVRKYK